MTGSQNLRFGVVGTGYWALELHATSVAATDGVELSAIWGRNGAAARAAGTRFGVPGFDDFDAFLSTVDALTFAVPPEVQGDLALRAIEARKHVLLEKPIAISIEAADALVAAAERTGVATMTFFTMLFDPRTRAIVEEAPAARWKSGAGLWLGSALLDENPFNTPWRHVKGGLWDLGPHAVSVLWKTVGPITGVDAIAGEADLVHLVFRHEDGRTSTASMTLRASAAADGFATVLWGERGRLDVPVDDVDALASHSTALRELADNARTGETNHACDIRFGRDVVRVLSLAEAALTARTSA